MSLFRSARIYVRLNPQGVKARNLDTGKEASESAASAFRHPRSLVSDFPEATRVVQTAVKEVMGTSFLRPVLLMHWEPKLEDGLSQIESRVLAELGTSAGARAVKVFHSNEPLPADWEAKVRQLMG